LSNATEKSIYSGKRLREAREARHISQEKLAELVDGHRNTIGKLERGEVNFTFDYMMKVARILKVKPSKLMDLIP
jgi:transcriptional regulator with XRE-family HTH domain